MAKIEYIKGSDGSANASVATVQSSRAPLASTIVVDTVAGINTGGFAGSMGTPHTFTDPITSETITVISEATCVDFFGYVDGSNLEIDAIAPGYTDLGSEVGDIVIIRPTTQWSDNVAEILEVNHADDGKLRPAIIYDSNGNEEVKFTATASAVNEFTVANAATGNDPTISATGGDTNVGFNFTPKGTGVFKIGGNPIDHGAWASWTPSWTDLTLGNGTAVCKYAQVGKTIFYRIELVFGSTTSISGSVTFTPPVNAVALTSPVRIMVGDLRMEDAGTANYAGGVQQETASSFLLLTKGATSTYVNYSALSSSAPFTWGTGDWFTITGSYEAA